MILSYYLIVSLLGCISILLTLRHTIIHSPKKPPMSRKSMLALAVPVSALVGALWPVALPLIYITTAIRVVRS